MIKDILMYLDKRSKKMSVYSMSLQIYRNVVIYNPNIRERLKNLLLYNIECERQGRLIDRDIMTGLLGMS